ncbi:MAG: hypothetical protein AB7S41_15825 [Parvibaculaceae bacterium]
MNVRASSLRLAAAVLAVGLLAGPATAQPVPGEPMFPALAAGPEGATQIVVEGPRYALTLNRVDGGWVAENHGDFPVRSAPVDAILASLGAMVAHDVVTENPVEYGALDVQGPGEGTEDIHVRLADANGNALVDAIVGAPAAIRDPDPLSGIYVRNVDDAAAWFVVGGFGIPARLSAWFDPLLQIPGPTVTSISILRGETLLMQADKVDPATGLYGLIAIAEEIGPMDRAILDIDALRGLTQAVVSVNAEDVVARDAVTVPAEPRIVRITTQTGLVLTLTVVEGTGGAWVTIDAEAAAPEATATADEINARTVNWAFQLPEFNTMTLSKEITELVIITAPASFF